MESHELSIFKYACSHAKAKITRFMSNRFKDSLNCNPAKYFRKKYHFPRVHSVRKIKSIKLELQMTYYLSNVSFLPSLFIPNSPNRSNNITLYKIPGELVYMYVYQLPSSIMIPACLVNSFCTLRDPKQTSALEGKSEIEYFLSSRRFASRDRLIFLSLPVSSNRSNSSRIKKKFAEQWYACTLFPFTVLEKTRISL